MNRCGSLRTRGGVRWVWGLALLLAASVPAPAFAHRERTEGVARSSGISIPSLTHGQMKVIADNLSAIRAVADDQLPNDSTMRRLQGYVNLQSFACFWGWAPGSLADESSPFNECAHAYLAGAQALLVHLQHMPKGNRAAVDALVRKIEIEMLMNDAALSLCRYSDEPFNTAQIIFPRWREIPFHAPTLFAFTAILTLIIGGSIGLFRVTGGPYLSQNS
jgi:hypothetical protein